MFAVKELYPDLQCLEHKSFEIYTIDYEEGLEINPLGSFNQQYDGQIASMFYNPYDRRIYVYQKIDAEKLGTEEVKLLSFDLGFENPVWTATPLGIASYFPDYDHTRDLSHFWYYNMTTPYINPSTNHIYVPNGGHSCVSKVPFEAKEPLLLHNDEWAWLSFPRLDYSFGGDITVDFVLGGENIVPDGYLNNSELQNLPLNEEYLKFNRYNENNGIWSSYPGNLTDSQSSLGYKLKLLYDPQPDNKWVLLSGTVLDPNTTFDLYDDKENWIGYYLYDEQDVFDALAGYIEDIESIRHQNYYCYRPHGGGIIFGPEGGGVSPPTGPEWACNNSIHNIKYGDMVILWPNKGIEAFSWMNSGEGGGENTTSRPEPTHYVYEETADYKPLIIELDATENPEEIGAFVGDTCVGACSVIEADTAVILLAYLDGRPADSVVFQEYSSAKSSGNHIINSYLVLNEEKGFYEKRIISTKEGNRRAFISFKKNKPVDVDNTNLSFRIWPNPASGSLYYSFETKSEVAVRISILDITGKLIAIPLDEKMESLKLSGEIQLKDTSGNELKPGIYLVQLKAGERIETKKVIVK